MFLMIRIQGNALPINTIFVKTVSLLDCITNATEKSVTYRSTMNLMLATAQTK